MNQTVEQLKDIRELEPIPDISFYLFLAIAVATLIIFIAILYMLLRNYKNRRKEDIYTKILYKLKKIDFNNSKKAAYDITKYGRFLAKQERNKKIFEQLLIRLQKYKFTPNPPEFKDEDIKYYDLFMDSLDE